MNIPENFPQLKELNGRKALYVDGKPFIMLGLQWDCDGCYTKEDMDPLFEHGRKMNLNMASLLLYWREVEPEKGRYRFEMLDHRIEMARKYGMKIVLVWFASYKNACLTYAPDYIKEDHDLYKKVVAKDGELLVNQCCPLSENTRRRDELALIEVFRHLREVDSQDHTVILFQMENETGVLQTDRCYCDACNAKFEAGDYRGAGVRAEEIFSSVCIAEYCDSLTKAVKEIYPLPVYINAWLESSWQNSVAGFGYPSGGPVAAMLPVFFKTLKHVDFVAPDLYQYSYKDFHFFCDAYTTKDNPLFLAECATGAGARTERNVFYAIGEYSAIGFDPWSISRCCPGFMATPLVSLANGRWSDEAYELQKSYKMISDAMYPIAMAQNTENLKVFVQEEGDSGTKLSFGKIDAIVQFSHPLNAARGLVVRLGGDTFLCVGHGAIIHFSADGGRKIPIVAAENGKYDGDKWAPGYRLAREGEPSAPIRFHECRTVKIKLDISGIR